MKKTLFLSLFLLNIAFAGFSQTIPPPYINYQAVLYDVNGANPNAPLTNQSFVTFVNINDELGNLLYEEEHYASTDVNGLITVKMGDGLYTAGPITNFNQINWGVGKYYLVVDFDINGTISSTAPEQLVTVPYSFYAGNAGNGMSSVIDNGDGTLTFNYADGTTYTTTQLTGLQGTSGSIPPGSVAGNTPYWDGSQWVVYGANFYNNGAGLGVGTVTPDASSLLDVSSNSQGFLAPRMTVTERNAIVNPSDGLQIFNTTSGCPNYYYNGNWREWCGIVVNPLITSLSCGTALLTGSLMSNQAANGVSVSVPYTGGNAAQYNAQSINSTGVTGLTATLSVGYFADGPGNLVYAITGTPTSSGTASFALTIGGQSCSFTSPVQVNLYPANSVFCTSGPTVIVDVTNPTTGKIWMDRNLGASQVAVSSTDAASYGDLYQWGRGNDGHQCRNSSTTTTLSASDTPGNADFITAPNTPFDWRSPQNASLWQGVNGVNNPCPSGYRIPTDPELVAERLSWSVNTSVGAFASVLKLPMAGYRSNSGSASLLSVGAFAYYWSSTVGGTLSRPLYFGSSDAGASDFYRAYGFSVRCIKDASAIPATLGALNCGSSSINGTLTSGTAATGVSASVPYTGGNGGSYAAQTISSTGVTGLTATLTSGTLANGAGSLSFAISGTPASSGIAGFALIIGGQSCTFTVAVQSALAAQYPAGSVFCAAGPTAIVDVTNPTTGKIWMDRNLGATQVAVASIDANSYGDLYQWGRRSDGHQCRTSSETSALSSIDQPAHGNFITINSGNDDWRSPQNVNLWQGVNGINNPCPSGYRLPTETEINAERLSWVTNNASGSFGSPLKWPVAGLRSNSNGAISGVGVSGVYWSSTVAGFYSRDLGFDSGSAYMESRNRARGYSVRCIKN
jgi:hypothetical protein